MIGDANRMIQAGSTIFYVFWEPVEGSPTWFVKRFTVSDIIYTDRAQAVVVNDSGESRILDLTPSVLADFYYTQEEANLAKKFRENEPRTYAWGRDVPR